MNSDTAFSEIPLASVIRPAGTGRMKWAVAVTAALTLVGTGAVYFSQPVVSVDPSAPPVVVEVRGMHCPIQCGLRVASALESLPWVAKDSVRADPKAGIVTFLVTDGDAVDEGEIRRVIERAGFAVGAVKFR